MLDRFRKTETVDRLLVHPQTDEHHVGGETVPAMKAVPDGLDGRHEDENRDEGQPGQNHRQTEPRLPAQTREGVATAKRLLASVD